MAVVFLIRGSYVGKDQERTFKVDVMITVASLGPGFLS